MKSVSISGSLRENVGKKDAKMHRSLDKVPCVLYGGKEQMCFTVADDDLQKLVYTPNAYTVNLSVNNKTYNAIMQDIQFHPVTDKILHIDFLEIFPNKPVVIDVPLKIEGVSEGVKKGGKLISKFRKLKIKALPADLPDHIAVNIEKLDIGNSIKISEIQLKGVTILDNPSSIVVSVQVTRNVTEEAKPGENK